jgi:hypothetical protein
MMSFNTDLYEKARYERHKDVLEEISLPYRERRAEEHSL